MDWNARLRAAFSGIADAPPADVLEELAQHAAAIYETARASGCSHEEADRRVADQIAGWCSEAALLRHRSRRPSAIVPPSTAPFLPLAGLVHDIRYAMRLLRRQPRHALVTILTLGLGIGATTVLFSVTYGVLMKPLAWPNAARLVELKETRGGSAPRFGAFTNTAYLAWRHKAATIEAIAGWSRSLVTLTSAGEPDRVRIVTAAPGLFAALGARPLAGALFTSRDETAPVVVLSESLWRQRYGADRAVLGRAVRLDDKPYTVIGVLPDDLAFPDHQSAAYVPFAIQPTAGSDLSLFNAIALLRPGVTGSQAAAEGTSRGRFAADTGMTTMAIFGNNGPIEVKAQPLRDALTAGVRRPLMLLLAAVALLLVTATANVASLQLARTTTRSREIAIRAALGAGTARVTRQLLAEAAVLGLAGGGLGLALTQALHRAMPALLPADFPRLDALGIDSAVLAFVLAVSVATGAVVGLLPALTSRRLNLVEALAEDGIAPLGAGTRGGAARSRAVIMAGQVAAACLLLVVASLVGRSFFALLNADRGYTLSDVLSARVSMPETMYPAPERRFALIDRVLARLAMTPGVADAAFTSELPLTAGGSTTAFDLQSPVRGVVHVQASPRIVSPRYFSALRIATVAGRVFSDADSESAQPVVVVNRAFARRYLPDAPLGARLPVIAYAPPEERAAEAIVIGVVNDTRYVTDGDTSQPEMFFSYRQMGGRLPVQTITLLVRAPGGSGSAAIALRAAVRDADERLVPDLVVPLEQRLLTTLAQPRLYATLLVGFATVALVIAAVGLFGLVSYTISLRSRELAIRSALGASRVDIFRVVLGQGLTVILAGLVVGLIASTWITGLLREQLYGIAPHDPLTFALVPLLLLAVGAAACLTAARRAANLDPLRVLRGSQ
jgi:predicted permease